MWPEYFLRPIFKSIILIEFFFKFLTILVNVQWISVIFDYFDKFYHDRLCDIRDI